jgi:hypothetical protein
MMTGAADGGHVADSLMDPQLFQSPAPMEDEPVADKHDHRPEANTKSKKFAFYFLNFSEQRLIIF